MNLKNPNGKIELHVFLTVYIFIFSKNIDNNIIYTLVLNYKTGCMYSTRAFKGIIL